MMRILFAVLCTGGGIFLLQAYVQPGLLEVENLRREQEVVTDTIDQAREVIRLRDELRGIYNSIAASDIEKIRKFLPAGSALSELLIDVDTLVKEAGVNTKSITFMEHADSPGSSGEVSSDDMQTLSITMNVKGTYEDFQELLTLLERNLRLIDVVHIKLQGQSDEKGLMNFEVMLQAYYQKRAIL